jgi:hypothetical protein
MLFRPRHTTRRRPRAAAARARPRLERLEDRCVPSVTPQEFAPLPTANSQPISLPVRNQIVIVLRTPSISDA